MKKTDSSGTEIYYKTNTQNTKGQNFKDAINAINENSRASSEAQNEYLRVTGQRKSEQSKKDNCRIVSDYISGEVFKDNLGFQYKFIKNNSCRGKFFIRTFDGEYFKGNYKIDDTGKEERIVCKWGSNSIEMENVFKCVHYTTNQIGLRTEKGNRGLTKVHPDFSLFGR